MWLVSQWVFYWQKFLMYLSINLMGNVLFFNISFKWHTSDWNLKKSKTIENVRNNKVKIERSLPSPEMKLLRYEYAPQNMGLWYADTLKPLLVLVIKTSRNAMELFCCLDKNNNIFQSTRFNHTMIFFKLTD